MNYIIELLNKTRIEVAPETFFLASLSHQDWLKLLENPELSPRMTTPFMIFRDKWEVTLLVDEIISKLSATRFGKRKHRETFGC